MKMALKIIIPLVILVLAFGGFKLLGSLRPEPQSRQPPPVVPLVDLARVSPEEHAPPVVSFGTVEAYFETGLTPQVSGKVMAVSPKFEPLFRFQFFQELDLMVRLDLLVMLQS